MRTILLQSQQILPLNSKDFLNFGAKEKMKSDFELLNQLAGQSQFPKEYIQFLMLVDANEKDQISNKFLKTFFYATSKVMDRNDLEEWLKKAPLPSRTYSGIDSMGQLYGKVKNALTLNRRIDSTLDAINKARNRMNEKQNKRAVKSLEVNTSKYRALSSELNGMIRNIKEDIFDIESTFASGKEL